MKIFKFALSAMLVVFCIFTSSTFAQSKIAINFYRFESFNDYSQSGGSAQVDFEYEKFMERLNSEMKTGRTKIISNTTTIGSSGSEISVGKLLYNAAYGELFNRCAKFNRR
jgi:hypothetical protein